MAAVSDVAGAWTALRAGGLDAALAEEVAAALGSPRGGQVRVVRLCDDEGEVGRRAWLLTRDRTEPGARSGWVAFQPSLNEPWLRFQPLSASGLSAVIGDFARSLDRERQS